MEHRDNLTCEACTCESIDVKETLKFSDEPLEVSKERASVQMQKFAQICSSVKQNEIRIKTECEEICIEETKVSNIFNVDEVYVKEEHSEEETQSTFPAVFTDIACNTTRSDDLKIEGDYTEDPLKSTEDISNKEINSTLFECYVCNKPFRLQNLLIEHMKKLHNKGKPFNCKICSNKFSRAYHLKTHMLIHTGDKPYKCNACPKDFYNTGDLKKHERIHTGEKPYKCDVCFKQFTQSVNLKTHKQRHTGKKLYKCAVCFKDFLTTAYLKKHLMIHVGDKCFKCDVCCKYFLSPGNLKNHQKVHTGEKPFKCDLCEKAFSQANTLKTHKKIHTGEKSYKCNVCSKGFFTSYHLRRHNSVHT